MKKSLVLALVVVYVLSICVVGYFGHNVRVYNPEVYPESIVITEVIDIDNNSVSIKYFDDGSKYILIPKYSEGYTVKIRFQIHPDETTKKNVYFSYTEDVCEVTEMTNEVISEIIVTFKKKPKSEKITIIATDRSNIQESLSIYFKG